MAEMKSNAKKVSDDVPSLKSRGMRMKGDKLAGSREKHDCNQASWSLKKSYKGKDK